MMAEFATNLRARLEKEEFIRLAKLSQRDIIYRVKKMHFFAYDGMIFYCKECEDEDFEVVIKCTRLDNIGFYEIQRKRK